MATDKPSILTLWGDHIGSYNTSHNNKWATGTSLPTSIASPLDCAERKE